MTADHRHRWRALQAWLEELTPDHQEQLLRSVERMVALAKRRDVGALADALEKLLAFTEELAADYQRFVREAHHGC